MIRFSHAFVFTSDLERMIAFYAHALGLRREDGPDPGFVMMRGEGGADLALHQVPPHIAEELAITSPPQWRDDTALKLCFEVDDLEARRRTILEHGGQARAPWSWSGTQLCECTDPEGNVIQIFVRAQ